MKLTEAKIREAQEVIEAVMRECDVSQIRIRGIITFMDGETALCSDYDLANLYIKRLHELAGTDAPPF